MYFRRNPCFLTDSWGCSPRTWRSTWARPTPWSTSRARASCSTSRRWWRSQNGARARTRCWPSATRPRACSAGRPGNIVAIRPLKDGVIADFEITEAMLRYFIRKVHNRKTLVRPRIVICVPFGHHRGGEARRARVAPSSAGAREVYLIEEPMAAAIGAGLPDHRAVRQHDRGHRRRHHRGRGDLAGRHRLQPVGPRRRRRDGRGDRPVHEAQVQPADRRADGRADQDRHRLGLSRCEERADDGGQGPRPGGRHSQDHRRSPPTRSARR